MMILITSGCGKNQRQIAQRGKYCLHKEVHFGERDRRALNKSLIESCETRKHRDGESSHNPIEERVPANRSGKIHIE